MEILIKIKHSFNETDEFTFFQSVSKDLQSEARQINAVKIYQPNTFKESKRLTLNFTSSNEQI